MASLVQVPVSGILLKTEGHFCNELRYDYSTVVINPQL